MLKNIKMSIFGDNIIGICYYGTIDKLIVIRILFN